MREEYRGPLSDILLAQATSNEEAIAYTECMMQIMLAPVAMCMTGLSLLTSKKAYAAGVSTVLTVVGATPLVLTGAALYYYIVEPVAPVAMEGVKYFGELLLDAAEYQGCLMDALLNDMCMECAPKTAALDRYMDNIAMALSSVSLCEDTLYCCIPKSERLLVSMYYSYSTIGNASHTTGADLVAFIKNEGMILWENVNKMLWDIPEYDGA